MNYVILKHSCIITKKKEQKKKIVTIRKRYEPSGHRRGISHRELWSTPVGSAARVACVRRHVSVGVTLFLRCLYAMHIVSANHFFGWLFFSILAQLAYGSGCDMGISEADFQTRKCALTLALCRKTNVPCLLLLRLSQRHLRGDCC